LGEAFLGEDEGEAFGLALGDFEAPFLGDDLEAPFLPADFDLPLAGDFDLPLAGDFEPLERPRPAVSVTK
jgi:hypothetical protein